MLQKQEPLDQDSSAYGSGSDGFTSASPGGSDHHSRDSNTPNLENTPINFYPKMSVSSLTFPINPAITGFDPLTPPSFEPIISPKMTNGVPQIKSETLGFPEVERDQNATLTPCTTPPTEVTPPKSPKSPEDNDEDDHLKRLQMAFEKNGMLPGSPRDNDHRDSGEDDGRSDYDIDEVDENGLRIPRVNSHGKVKTFKCKQCDFVAVTKMDFWEHSRAHIKADKLLTCPKCPFVTEYKHHLEYHLRNHFGSKPFKCDKCSYTCVNKSMLNSHLKSHSNVYQYRCSDCTYATKYCHSLKLHLRKYKHNPAMVLNPDGSPNPLPIIDVYGTRRGPKQKQQKDEQIQDSPLQPVLPQQNIFNHFMVPNGQAAVQLPFPWLGAFPGALGNPLLLPQISPDQNNHSSNESNLCSSPDSMENDTRDSILDELKPEPENKPTSPKLNTTALDLSKPEINLPINIPEIPIQTPLAIPLVSKNRRKGRAFKLERLPVSEDMSSEEEDSREKPTTPKVEETNKKSDIFNCQYCDIAFKDVVMYTMHMGYHGYKDPFTCNMCGEQSGDKVSFFLHIARTSHS